MRFPVFARRTNPSVDKAILRKSKFYVEEAVANGRADWVDELDHTKGIVCREMLYFGERELKPMPETENSVSIEAGGRLKWMPPKHESWLHTLRTSNIPNVRDFAAVS